MIGMMVEFTVAPGNTDAFERAFAVQAAAVRANEPGNRLYELVKSRTLADSYTPIEIYEDDAARGAHQKAIGHLQRLHIRRKARASLKSFVRKSRATTNGVPKTLACRRTTVRKRFSTSAAFDQGCKKATPNRQDWSSSIAT